MRLKKFKILKQSMIHHRSKCGKLRLSSKIEGNNIRYIDENTKKYWVISKKDYLNSFDMNLRAFLEMQINKGFEKATSCLEDIINSSRLK